MLFSNNYQIWSKTKKQIFLKKQKSKLLEHHQNLVFGTFMVKFNVIVALILNRILITEIILI